MFWLQPETYLYFGGSLIVHICVGIHPGKIGGDLVYYHLYNV